MRIIVVGCGRLGAELAYRMFRAGHEVAVVDQQSAAFENLRADYRGRTLQGDVLARDLLLRAGIDSADGLAAVTNSDSVNAVVAYVARTEFRVPNVVVRSYAPTWLPLHEAFGSQVVSSTTWGAQRIDQLLMHPVLTGVLSAGNGEVQVFEMVVPDGWQGRSLAELYPEAECRVVALTRAGQAVIPDPKTPLAAGDVVHFGSTLGGIDALRRRLGKEREG